MTSPNRRAVPRAGIVGTGLMGASIGLALRAQGWHVTGHDADSERQSQALALGAIDVTGHDNAAEVVFVATPVSMVADVARSVLAASSRPSEVIVTDVGGVKETIVAGVGHPRFVGGHPMAGSEQEGAAGADATMFTGATWVLTPTAATEPGAYARLRTIVGTMGADVVALSPHHHDDLVAVVSHVPHLAAATLMRVAADGADEHAALMRLAAGGFRDMTRIASGHPGIWPDICIQNADAIVGGLDRLMDALTQIRQAVKVGDRDAILDLLERARTARLNLPARWDRPIELAEMRIPVPDRPGTVAEVTTLAGEMGVNIEDMEIAHSAEGDRGVLVLVVDAGAAESMRAALSQRGLHPAVQPLS